MTETALYTILFIIIFVFIIYNLFETRAINKAMKLPQQAGIESLVGKDAKVLSIISQKEEEMHLQVKIDGAIWKAIAKSDSRRKIKVGDTVNVLETKDLKLIVT
jgi:membrane protein implicated in regulation of membrane protease activity